MRPKHFIFVLTLLLVCQTGKAQEITRVHEVEEQLTSCLDSADQDEEWNNGTSCINDATKAMDRVLNQYYQLLMDSLTDELQTQLRMTQRAWIKFKDEEFKYLEGMEVHREYKRSRGYGQALSWQLLNTIKDRAKELEEYYFYWTRECKKN